MNVTPDALPFLIGKSGASINKLREDLGVDLTVLRVRSQVRPHCTLYEIKIYDRQFDFFQQQNTMPPE